MKHLALAITEKAKDRIAALLSSRAPGSLPALMYGRSQTYSLDGKLKDETDWRWQLQVYSKEQAETLQRDFAAKGHELIFDAGGVVLCVPQFQFIDHLSGKTVDVANGDICVK
jgi:hypothetical protein